LAPRLHSRDDALSGSGPERVEEGGIDYEYEDDDEDDHN
jgi:hypothetical protein